MIFVYAFFARHTTPLNFIILFVVVIYEPNLTFILFHLPSPFSLPPPPAPPQKCLGQPFFPLNFSLVPPPPLIFVPPHSPPFPLRRAAAAAHRTPSSPSARAPATSCTPPASVCVRRKARNHQFKKPFVITPTPILPVLPLRPSGASPWPPATNSQSSGSGWLLPLLERLIAHMSLAFQRLVPYFPCRISCRREFVDLFQALKLGILHGVWLLMLLPFMLLRGLF